MINDFEAVGKHCSAAGEERLKNSVGMDPFHLSRARCRIEGDHTRCLSAGKERPNCHGSPSPGSYEMGPQGGERVAVVASHDGFDLGMLESHGYNEVTMCPVPERTPYGSGGAEDVGAMTVAEIMVKPVVTAEPGMSVGAARRLSRRERVRHLPVLDGERLLVGIVSDRDLRVARSDATPVKEIMTKPVFVLSPGTPVRQAARLFRERRFGAMPVLAGRELAGIVSVVDILRALDEEDENRCSVLEEGER